MPDSEGLLLAAPGSGPLAATGLTGSPLGPTWGAGVLWVQVEGTVSGQDHRAAGCAVGDDRCRGRRGQPCRAESRARARRILSAGLGWEGAASPPIPALGLLTVPTAGP